MNRAAAKEIRLLLPSFGWVFFLCIVAFLAIPLVRAALFTVIMFVCSVWLCANVFGAEFSYGTIQQSLAQPIARDAIWSRKMVLLSGLVVALIAGRVVVGGVKYPIYFNDLLLPALAVCTVPTWTIICRSLWN